MVDLSTSLVQHKPSVTIYVKDNEWMDVGAWVYRHFDEMSGVSFLPHSDHTYRQAPYQEITEAEYNDWVKGCLPMLIGKILDCTSLKIVPQAARPWPVPGGGLCEVVDLA